MPYTSRPPLIIVLVESFSIFPAVPLGIHHALEKNTWSVFGIACAFVQGLLDGEAGVESDAAKVVKVISMEGRDCMRGVRRTNQLFAVIRIWAGEKIEFCGRTELEGTHGMGHSQLERGVNIVPSSSSLHDAYKHKSSAEGWFVTFSRHIIACISESVSALMYLMNKPYLVDKRHKQCIGNESRHVFRYCDLYK